MKNVPKRMCVACREMKDKASMMRIVRTKDGEIKLDPSGKVGGRGAYICDSPDCIKKLTRSRYLGKIFQTAVPDEVYDGIEEAYGAKQS